MEIACLDLEGVLVPEIWIAFAEKTGIDALKATTRDIPDYDVLMKQRLRILGELGPADRGDGGRHAPHAVADGDERVG